MAYEKRPYPLLDEVKMHLYLWASDNEWKKLPVPLKEALTMAMNEIKVSEALKAYGIEDERLPAASTQSEEKRKFLAIFKSKYFEYSSMQYTGSVEPATLFIITNLVKRLMEEGSNSLEYLNWFFDEFMRDEYNKEKYAPPSIKIATGSWIVDKYIFQNKDLLKVKKRDLQNVKAKNAITTLAMEFLKEIRDKEFGQKVLSFSRGEITVRKFSQIFMALLQKQGSPEMIESLKQIVGE